MCFFHGLLGEPEGGSGEKQGEGGDLPLPINKNAEIGVSIRASAILWCMDGSRSWWIWREGLAGGFQAVAPRPRSATWWHLFGRTGLRSGFRSS